VNRTSRFVVACLVTPAAFTIAIALVWTIFIPRVPGHYWQLLGQVVPFVAKWVYSCFLILFAPVAFWLFQRQQDTLRNLSLYGALLGSVPAGIAMFLVFGLATRGSLDVGALIGFVLVALVAGAAGGAVLGMTFSAVKGRA